MKKNLLSQVAWLFLAITVTSHATSLDPPAEVLSFISKPGNNAINIEPLTLKVTANVVPNATRYTIELNPNADFSGTSFTKTSTIDNQRTLVFKNLAYNTRYYARATSNVSSGFGKVTSFTTRVEAFTTLAEPVNAIASLDPIAIRVKPVPLSFATYYTIQISTASTFDNLVTTLESAEPLFLLRTLQYSTTYYARVKTDINTTYGPTTTFSTRARSSKLRLWGVTSSEGNDGRGTIYSYSIDSSKFTKNFDYMRQDEWDEENLTSCLMPSPYGGFYVLTQTIRSTSTSGSLYHFKDGVLGYVSGLGQRGGNIMLASNYNFYVIQGPFMASERIIRTSESHYQVIHKFNTKTSKEHSTAEAPLIELPDGFLYGTAAQGGLNKAGVIYKLKLDGSSYTVIYTFDLATSGGGTKAGLTDGHDGYLYGVAYKGGLSNAGTVFKLKPDGSEFTVLHHFQEAFGSDPWAEVIVKDGVIYGQTMSGGTGSSGTVYRLNTDGSNFAVLHNFQNDGSDGYSPQEALVADDAGYLYGVTTLGGINNMGTLFKIKTNGTDYSKLVNFSPHGGSRPGPLLLTDDISSAPSAIALARKAVPVQKQNVEKEVTTFFPNPFSDQINISSQSILTNISITDISGKVLYQIEKVNNNSIQFGKDLPSGIYILKMIEGNRPVVRSLIKK